MRVLQGVTNAHLGFFRGSGLSHGLWELFTRDPVQGFQGLGHDGDALAGCRFMKSESDVSSCSLNRGIWACWWRRRSQDRMLIDKGFRGLTEARRDKQDSCCLDRLHYIELVF